MAVWAPHLRAEASYVGSLKSALKLSRLLYPSQNRRSAFGVLSMCAGRRVSRVVHPSKYLFGAESSLKRHVLRAELARTKKYCFRGLSSLPEVLERTPDPLGYWPLQIRCGLTLNHNHYAHRKFMIAVLRVDAAINYATK